LNHLKTRIEALLDTLKEDGLEIETVETNYPLTSPYYT